MSAMTTSADTIRALKAKAEAAEAKRKSIESELEFCSDLFAEYSGWALALFEAISRYTETQEGNAEPLDIGDRGTVSKLAAIGKYLTDGAGNAAQDYQQQLGH